MRRRFFCLATLAAGLMPFLAHAQQDGRPARGNVQAIAIDPPSSGTSTIHVVAGNRIFESANKGSTWTATANSGLTGRGTISGFPLAIDPHNSATIYAGTNGGIFKTSDDGANWAAINSGLPGRKISCAAPPRAPGPDTNALAIAIDPSNSATIYAVVSSATVGAASGLGSIFKSTDGGANWASASSGLTNTFAETLAIDPTNPSTLYAGTVPGGIFKSTDGGASWNSVNFTTVSTDISALVVDPVKAGTIYAVARNTVIQRSCPKGVSFQGTDSGIFKTTNGGESWVAVNSGLPTFTDIISSALAIDPVNSNILYTALIGTGTAGVFKTTDGGANWVAASSGLTFDPSLGPLGPAVLAVDPANPATVFAGTFGAGVFKTTDSAASWSDITSNLTAADVGSLIVNPGNGK